MEKNKVVLISGGSSGLGAACLSEFLASGYRAAIIGRNFEKAKALIDNLSAGDLVEILIGDVSNGAFCEEVVDRTVRRFGCLDVLVNSAAVMHRGTAIETDDKAWAESLAVNVSGTFYLCRAAIRHMMSRSGGGAIINVASDWGLVGGKGHVAYCACKGAVVNMTRALALDHAKDGIRINVICPGEIRTPMLASGLEQRGFDPEQGFEQLGATLPIGRVSEPEEQARCIRFLASSDASFMIGAVLSVDGGSTAQ